MLLKILLHILNKQYEVSNTHVQNNDDNEGKITVL